MHQIVNVYDLPIFRMISIFQIVFILFQNSVQIVKLILTLIYAEIFNFVMINSFFNNI